MTIEEKIIKLAEVAGFTDIMLPMGFHQQMSDEKSKKCGGRWRFAIPKYFEDLNAVHDLFKCVPQNLKPKYFAILCSQISSLITLNGYYEATEATASQRCEAIGKTLNLW